jgi:hypothetical protein
MIDAPFVTSIDTVLPVVGRHSASLDQAEASASPSFGLVSVLRDRNPPFFMGNHP